MVTFRGPTGGQLRLWPGLLPARPIGFARWLETPLPDFAYGYAAWWPRCLPHLGHHHGCLPRPGWGHARAGLLLLSPSTSSWLSSAARVVACGGLVAGQGHLFHTAPWLATKFCQTPVSGAKWDVSWNLSHTLVLEGATGGRAQRNIGQESPQTAQPCSRAAAGVSRSIAASAIMGRAGSNPSHQRSCPPVMPPSVTRTTHYQPHSTLTVDLVASNTACRGHNPGTTRQ